MSARTLLLAALVALALVHGAWFGSHGEWVAVAVFAGPVLACALAALGGRRTAAFWSGVLALLWFSHGVMVAWTRPPERAFALAEVALSLAIVAVASLPGLRARFGGRRGPADGADL